MTRSMEIHVDYWAGENIWEETSTSHDINQVIVNKLIINTLCIPRLKFCFVCKRLTSDARIKSYKRRQIKVRS